MKPSWCKLKAQIGTADPAPMRLIARKYVGGENMCDIKSTHKIDEYTELEMRCSNKDKRYEDTVKVRVVENKLEWKEPNGAIARFQRCP